MSPEFANDWLLTLTHEEIGQMIGALGVTDLTSADVQKQTGAQLTDSIANGKGKKIPAYKGKITDDQIKGLVGYIRALAKK